MPGALLIRFDQTDLDNKFYLCRSCQAHIVLSRNFRVIFADHGLTGRVFDNVVNVHIFSPDRGWKVGDHTVTDVYCVQCCNILGVKIIQTPENEAIVKEGDFVLYASKLRMWNGHEVVDE